MSSSLLLCVILHSDCNEGILAAVTDAIDVHCVTSTRGHRRRRHCVRAVVAATAAEAVAAGVHPGAAR